MLTLSTRVGVSQRYPIQVTTSLLPPYSPEISYYTSADANNLQVFINLVDVETIDLRTKLRITIEGAGVKLTTSPGYVPPALVLQGGVPEMLSGFDLRNYLNPDHMEFEGMTRAEFIRTGQFPEGFYTFTIEVLDYNRGVQLSNASMATAWIVLNDPPLINFPFNGDKLITNEPQTINFSWLGRHLASPNSAFSTEYEFTLYEMYPGQSNPDIAVRSSNSIYRTTTSQSSLFYGPAEPLLVPGKQYAFRIQAYDISGRDLFKNDGYSETYWFQYGDACLGLTNVSGESVGEDRIKITWEPDFSHTGFEIHYRQTGKTSWMTESTLATSQILPDLQPNTEYEYKVVGKCQQYYGAESTIRTLTTEASAITEDDTEYACGTESPLDDLSPVPLDKSLRILDKFYIGGASIIVLSVTANPDGSYSGTGYTPAPMFNGAGIKVNIKNVVINEDYHAIAGRVVTVYNVEGGFIVGDQGNSNSDGSSTVTDVPVEAVTVTEDIETVTVTDDGTIVLTDASGEVIPLPVGDDENPVTLPEEGEFLVIEDSEGESWTVDSNGNVSKGLPDTGTGGTGTDAPDAVGADEDIDFIIAFTPSGTQVYGFDDPTKDNKTQNSLSSNYTKTQIQDEDYWVAWKSLATGYMDAVDVTTTAETFPDYVGFKIGESGLAAQPGDTDQRKQLTLTGKSNNNVETLTAYARQENEAGDTEEIILGQLKVKTYDKVREKVVIVPVNNANAPDAYSLSQELNRIYDPAVAEWEVELANSYQTSIETIASLTEGESGVFSSFPSNMADFNKAYKKSANVDNNTYYLFLIPGTGDGRSGFMPFKRQYGYIWMGNIGSNAAQTIAHELGHGAFRLRHTFSSDAFVAAQGTTDNLMDYSNGTDLYKHQWDFVHDPESMVGWFQEDTESAYEVKEGSFSFYINEYVDDASTFHQKYGFIAPTGAIIDLPNEVNHLLFSKESGVLNGFYIGETKYMAIFGGNVLYGYIPLSEFQDEINRGFTDEVLSKIESEKLTLNKSSISKKVFSIYQETIAGNEFFECYSMYSWAYAENSVELYGKYYEGVGIPFEKENLDYLGQIGDQCSTVSQDIRSGIGESYYKYMINKMTETGWPITDEENQNLTETANYLSEKTDLKSFAFYSHIKEDNDWIKVFITNQGGDINSDIPDDILEFFYEKKLFNKTDFDSDDSKGYFRFHNESDDFDVIFSTVDLWSGIDKSSYNTLSYDYAKRDGSPYHYTFRDLTTRYNYKVYDSSSDIFTVILESEKDRNASGISIVDGYAQFTAMVGTNAGYAFIAKTSAEYAEMVASGYFGQRLAGEYGAFLIGQLVETLGQEVFKNLLRKYGAKVLREALIDYSVQVLMNYYFESEKYPTLKSAADPGAINWVTLTASSALGTAKFSSIYLELGVSASLSCFLEGWTGPGEIKDEYSWLDCGKGVFGALAGKLLGATVTSAPKAITFFGKYTATQLRAGFRKLGIADDSVEELIKKIKGVTDDLFDRVSSGNKISNTIDDIGRESLESSSVNDEIVKMSNAITDNTKKFWANHEVNVTKYLRETYGNSQVGRQITVDITLKNGTKITCRLDNLVKSGDKYKIIDAKSSVNLDLSTKTVDDLVNSWSTTNQKSFYKALKENSIQSIEPRGARADEYFNDLGLDVPSNLYIENTIDFFVNDTAVEGYSIFIKSLIF